MYSHIFCGSLFNVLHILVDNDLNEQITSDIVGQGLAPAVFTKIKIIWIWFGVITYLSILIVLYLFSKSNNCSFVIFPYCDKFISAGASPCPTNPFRITWAKRSCLSFRLLRIHLLRQRKAILGSIWWGSCHEVIQSQVTEGETTCV